MVVGFLVLGLGGGCELFIDINGDGNPPLDNPRPGPIDAGGVDAFAGPACARDSRFVDLGVPGTRYLVSSSSSGGVAYEVCEQDAATLVSINTDVEYEAVRALARSLPDCDGCLWTSLDQGSGEANPEDGWTWGVDFTTDQIRWAEGDPDDSDGIESGEEQCGVMDGAGLRDVSCLTFALALCECDVSSAPVLDAGPTVDAAVADAAVDASP